MSVHQVRIYGATADWCQDLAKRIAAHSPRSTGNPVAIVDNDSESQVPSADLSNLTKPHMFNVGAPRKLGAAAQREIRKPCRRSSTKKLAITLGWKRNVSLGQLFATIHDVQLEGFCCSNSCREHSHPRNDHRSEPEGAIRGSTKIGPVLEVKVTTHFVRCVIEIKIGSVSKTPNPILDRDQQEC